MRLDRFICKSTELSRDEARAAITQGQVCIAGDVIKDCTHQLYITSTAPALPVTLAGQRLVMRPFRYLMLHKPAGMICSNIDEHYPSLFNLLQIDHPDELHVVGRLDVDTTGLVLLTDDGHWSFAITHPQSTCEKTYQVTLRDAITVTDFQQLQQRFAQGIQLQGESMLTRPARLEVADRSEGLRCRQVLLTLQEGKFHQIKRMFAAVGNRVQQLHRLQIGSIRLDIAQGQWRPLDADEITHV